VPFEENSQGRPPEKGPGKAAGRFRGLGSSVFCTAISPDGARVIAGDNAGNLVLWDVKTGKVVISGSVPSMKNVRGVSTVKFTPDGRHVLADSGDHQLRLFEVAKGERVGIFSNHEDLVWSVAIAQVDGKVVALSGGGGQQVLGPKGVQNLPGARDYAVRLWDLFQGREIRRFSGHESIVLGVAFCPNGRHFVSVGRDKTVRLWDLATGRQLRLLGQHESTARSVAVAPDGRSAVSGGDDCKVRFWRLPAQGDDLAAAFKSNDLAAVQKALADLDTMGPDALRAYPEVVKALTHADAKFHEPATQALTGIAEYCQTSNVKPAPPLVADLVAALKSAETADRRYALALTLGALGPAASDAVPALSDLVTATNDARIVGAAVKALGKIGDANAAPALETALRHPDAAVRGQAATALVALGPGSVTVKTLLDLLRSDPSADVRAAADKALRAKLPSLTKDDVPPLRDGLKSGKPAVCVYCADAVARLGGQARDAVPELAALLEADDREVRLHAVQALQGVGEAAQPALPGLERLLSADKEKDRRVSAAAALALLKIDPAAKQDKLIDFLVKALKPEAIGDLDDAGAQALAAQCRDALVEIGRPAAKPLVKALDVTYHAPDRLNTEARANIYLVLAKLKGKANVDDAPVLLKKCITKEADLINRSTSVEEVNQRRRAHELAKKALVCVYNDKD
jgi:HEAT repeat protein